MIKRNPPTYPQGFSSVTLNIGIKDNADDFALVCSDVPCVAAAVFTQSTFAGPSVRISKTSPMRDRAQGIVVIARNANVATGPAGEQNARYVQRISAQIAGIAPEQMIIASTGVIGQPYPMDKVEAALSRARQAIGPADFDAAAAAMMTTDTYSKVSSLRIGDASLIGIAKGVGMIEPNMATMLAFFFTDAAVDVQNLETIFKRVMGTTFNALSIDTDTSTSDTAAIFANGLAGDVDLDEFEHALHHVALDLVKMMASDGEGASKLLIVNVSGAADAGQARSVAKSIVNSPLVKTAVHGADPNWGRVAMAIGKVPIEGIRQQHVKIAFGDIEMHPNTPDEASLREAAKYLEAPEISINVHLAMGDSEFSAYGCDLTEGYIRINADYTS